MRIASHSSLGISHDTFTDYGGEIQVQGHPQPHFISLTGNITQIVCADRRLRGRLQFSGFKIHKFNVVSECDLVCSEGFAPLKECHPAPAAFFRKVLNKDSC